MEEAARCFGSRSAVRVRAGKDISGDRMRDLYLANKYAVWTTIGQRVGCNTVRHTELPVVRRLSGLRKRVVEGVGFSLLGGFRSALL